MYEDPVNEAIRHLSPAETARRLGVTVKALRLYEAKGLVTPMRLSNGYRAYGSEAVARLHQVLALKRLGLSLSRIAELLADCKLGLDAVLALQEQVLRGDRQKLDSALSLIAAARRRLGAGEVLSIDDLTTLTRETTVIEPMNDQDMKALFDPLAEKHFTDAKREALASRNFGAEDQAEASAIWEDLIAECKVLMAKGDPTSPEAIDLARRWAAQLAKFTQGDPAMAQKASAVWKDAMANAEAAPRLPLTPEMFDFIGQAGAALKARGQVS
jgi:DNA-binding transcriptional MerR regulator